MTTCIFFCIATICICGTVILCKIYGNRKDQNR